MGILNKLISGYVQIRTYISEIKEERGNIRVEMVIPAEKFSRVFTGDINPEELKRKEVQLFIPKVHTESKAEEQRKELAEQKKLLKERRKKERKAEKERKKQEKNYKESIKSAKDL